MVKLRICLAQINTTLGDFEGNYNKIKEHTEKAIEFKADLVVFPELTVCGYPPEDLLLIPEFIDKNMQYWSKVCTLTKAGNISILFGWTQHIGDKLYNALTFADNGYPICQQYKKALPNYGVFDEKRYFDSWDSGEFGVPYLKEFGLAFNICEDSWVKDGPWVEQVISDKVDIIINCSASPFYSGKYKVRVDTFKQITDKGKHFVFCNLVGGQDELVFDGNSFVMDPKGEVVARASAFQEDLLVVDFEKDDTGTITSKGDSASYRKDNHFKDIYDALALGLKDYLNKNGFKHAYIGLSGGIDSAIVLCIAEDVLGSDNVTAIFMPSKYSSSESLEDAYALANNLGLKLKIISIEDIYDKYEFALYDDFFTTPTNVAEENIQARIRGNILMAFSNKFGGIVLTTGNKSEMSVGYATLYGDTAGGFEVIKDLYKTEVYGIANYINSGSVEVIPERIITKAPTAELKPDQRDSDSLPPYEVLDGILRAYIEHNNVNYRDYDKETVDRIIRMVDSNEYKRRQVPIGIKITERALGKDRRMPITNKFRIGG